jgi:DNA polymerase III alpha subunit
MTDIDIDFHDRTQAMAVLKHIKASRIENDKRVQHNTGVYLQSIPFDPVTNLAGIEYKEAEERGYFKIDFLNVNIYKDIKDEAHLLRLMETPPLWDLLLEDEFTNGLFHVNGHGSILRQMKPASIEQLAAVLAMIRPAKRHLIGKDWSEVNSQVWVKPEGGEYYFKKSHATAYAMAIAVQMNLICEQVSAQGA